MASLVGEVLFVALSRLQAAGVVVLASIGRDGPHHANRLSYAAQLACRRRQLARLVRSAAHGFRTRLRCVTAGASGCRRLPPPDGADLPHESTESFYIHCVNAQHRVLPEGIITITSGLINSALVAPRGVSCGSRREASRHCMSFTK